MKFLFKSLRSSPSSTGREWANALHESLRTTSTLPSQVHADNEVSYLLKYFSTSFSESEIFSNYFLCFPLVTRTVSCSWWSESLVDLASLMAGNISNSLLFIFSYFHFKGWRVKMRCELSSLLSFAIFFFFSSFINLPAQLSNILFILLANVWKRTNEVMFSLIAFTMLTTCCERTQTLIPSCLALNTKYNNSPVLFNTSLKMV